MPLFTKKQQTNGNHAIATTVVEPSLTIGFDVQTHEPLTRPLSLLSQLSWHSLGPSRCGKTNHATFERHQMLQQCIPFISIDTEGGSHKNDVAYLAKHPELAIANKVIVIDLSDPDVGWVGINPIHLFPHSPTLPVLVDILLDVVSTVWAEQSRSTPMLRRILKNFFTLLCEQRLSMQEMQYLLETGQSEVRQKLAMASNNERVKKEVLTLDVMSPARQDDKLSSAMNRVSEFTDSIALQRVLGRTDENIIDIEDIIENRRTVLVNLSLEGGTMSEDSARLVASLLISMFVAYGMMRPEDVAKDKPYFIWADEFPSYVSSRMSKGLDQLLKRGIVFSFLNQHLHQIYSQDEWLYHSIQQNARLKICFALNDPSDLRTMEEFLFTGQMDLHKVKQSAFSGLEARPVFYTPEELRILNQEKIHRQQQGQFILKLASDPPRFLYCPYVPTESVTEDEMETLRCILRDLSPGLYWSGEQADEHIRVRHEELEKEEEPSVQPNEGSSQPIQLHS